MIRSPSTLFKRDDRKSLFLHIFKHCKLLYIFSFLLLVAGMFIIASFLSRSSSRTESMTSNNMQDTRVAETVSNISEKMPLSPFCEYKFQLNNRDRRDRKSFKGQIGLEPEYQPHVYIPREKESISLTAVPPSLVVVVPFTERDFLSGNLLDSISAWGGYGNSCPLTSGFNKSIALALYFHKDAGEFLLEGSQNKKMFDKALSQSKAKECFGEVIFLSANLEGSRDLYPFGPTHMFYSLFQRNFTRLNAYDYMFWMEHDTHPIRPGWLDALLYDITFSSDFLVRGSIHRGRWLDSVMFDKQYESMVPWIGHINGNAIYRLRDDRLHYLVANAMRNFAEKDGYLSSFDVSIWINSVTSLRSNWNCFRDYAHLIQYSDLLVALGKPIPGNEKYHKLDYLQQQYPNTMLIHGTVL